MKGCDKILKNGTSPGGSTRSLLAIHCGLCGIYFNLIWGRYLFCVYHLVSAPPEGLLKVGMTHQLTVTFRDQVLR